MKGNVATCLFTRLEEPRVSDSPVSAENVIYEAFVVEGVVGGVSLNCLHGEREKWRYICFSSFQASLHIPFPTEKQ